MSKKVSIIFGTRPEAIKLVPVILELKKHTEFEVSVCITAQHREMLDQVLEIFEITPDCDLNIMKPNQSLSDLTANCIKLLDRYVKEFNPDIILVQGDTTSAFAGSLVAFYNKILVGHVEAGLRTWNKYSPFPEEINRVLTTKIADIHFAPTKLSKENLLNDNVESSKILITGNTVIDALKIARGKVILNKPHVPGIDQDIIYKDDRKLVLITGHRRENFGDSFNNICIAIAELAAKFDDVYFVYPVHMNPNVREPVFRLLGNKSNVFLIEPLSYLPFVSLMMRSTIILTDSGGVQEEAPSLGKPVLVMRENTERPEAIDAGTVKLVGTSVHKIIEETTDLLLDETKFNKMANAINPYGDGKAASRIVDELLKTFNFR
jgi:UDP-N-acetylglucosamine 2-epimerase (non-hydrolysing)